MLRCSLPWFPPKGRPKLVDVFRVACGSTQSNSTRSLAYQKVIRAQKRDPNARGNPALEDESKPTNRTFGVDRFVSTFHPEKIQDSDIRDFSSGLKSHSFRGAGSGPSRNSFLLSYTVKDCFPQDLRGALYFTTPPGAPLILSELRIRRMEGGASSFDQGEDLLTPDGLTWNVPLYSIIGSKTIYRHLVPVLIHDGWFDQAFVQKWAKTPRNVTIVRSSGKVLHSLGQPFKIDCATDRMFRLCVFNEHEAGLMPCVELPFISNEKLPKMYRGSVKGKMQVCFERSTYPPHVAAGEFLVLRVLKVIEPMVNMAEATVPKEGELFMTRVRDNDRFWPPDIDGVLSPYPFALKLNNGKEDDTYKVLGLLMPEKKSD